MRLGREIAENDSADATSLCDRTEAFANGSDQRNPIGMHIPSTDGASRRHTRSSVSPWNRARRACEATSRRALLRGGDATAPEQSDPLIRAAADTAPVMAAVWNTITRVDPGLLILSASSIEEEMVPLTAQDRTTAQLAVVFGSVALTLAAIGLSGVLSYGVARRTGEIAIRIALGAQSGRVISMILGETIGVVGVGLALGGGMAYAASRVIGSRLYGVGPQDPLTLAVATGLLLVVAFCAAYVPAARASRVDPMMALRQY